MPKVNRCIVHAINFLKKNDKNNDLVQKTQDKVDINEVIINCKEGHRISILLKYFHFYFHETQRR